MASFSFLQARCEFVMSSCHKCGSGCEIRRAFLKRPENFSGPETAPQSSRYDFRVFLKAPEKYVIFPRKLHGYSLPPEKRFRVCFSCTCLIKWRPPIYFLGQNKWPRSCIKRERVELGGEREQCRKEIRILPKRISMANSS